MNFEMQEYKHLMPINAHDDVLLAQAISDEAIIEQAVKYNLIDMSRPNTPDSPDKGPTI